jgi:hypothetical protein
MDANRISPISLRALAFFAASAVMGLGFVVLGPITVIRWLGLIALVCCIAGGAMQIALLRDIDPAALAGLRAKLSLHHAARLARMLLARMRIIAHRIPASAESYGRWLTAPLREPHIGAIVP